MNKQLAAAGLLCLLALVFFYPKSLTREESAGPDTLCNCLGRSSGGSCYGLPVLCARLAPTKPGDSLEDKPQLEIALLLDKSKSMEGSRLEKAKQAADTLIQRLPDSDHMAIIAFDSDATVIQEFTGERQALSQALSPVQARDETYYVPALRKAQAIFESRDMTTRRIIFLSDGEPSKHEDIQSIYDLAHHLSGQGICIYTIGYGSDVFAESRAENILQSIANISREQAGCGRYYHAAEDMPALSEVFSHIYLDFADKELSLDADFPVLANSTHVPLSVRTNVLSVCSYRLNSGNREMLFSEDAILDARAGLNSLNITCRKSVGDMQEKQEDFQFYVRTGLLSMPTRKPAARQELRPLEPHEVEFLLRDIADKQQLEVTRKQSSYRGATMVYLFVKNTKPVALHNVRISEEFPRALISNPQDVSSEHRHEIAGTNPLSISFPFREIQPEELVSIAYLVDRELDSMQLGSIKTSIHFDDFASEDFAQIIAAQQGTQDAFDISYGFRESGSTTSARISLKPKASVQALRIYLNIPKCMAYELNKVHFKDQNFRVVSEDPLVMWHLPEATEAHDIEYEIDKRLEEECRSQISVVAIGEPAEQEQDRAHSLVILLPLFLIPLVIIIIVNRRFLESQPLHPHRKAVRLALMLFFLALLAYLFWPVSLVREDTLCSCFGVGSRDTCFGLAYACTVPRQLLQVHEQAAEQCSPTCSDLQDYIHHDPYRQAERGTDLIILLDRSKSMEGETMQEAKAALVSLVKQIEAGNRVSIIQFDDTSQLVQEFTTDRQRLIAGIENITVGHATKYVPALSTAHRHFLHSGDKTREWQVIFVSDGAPGDEGKPESIYSTVGRMVADDICVSTVGFGSEITPGSEAETVLMEMSRLSNAGSGCGIYYYSTIEIGSLQHVLGRMYQELKQATAGLDIAVSINTLELNSMEELRISAEISSRDNALQIPGSATIGSRQICSPPARVRLKLDDGNNNLEFPMEYSTLSGTHQFSRSGLPAGVYSATITANLDGEKDCGINATASVGTLAVRNRQGFDLCYTDDCFEVGRYLFSTDDVSVVNVLITDYAYVPRNISIADRTTIVWKNIGQKPHTVTSGRDSFDGRFHSGIIPPGGMFNVTFEQGENCEYFDNMSRAMRGATVMNRSRSISIGNFSLEYRSNIDLALVIDKSGSMTGGNMENVRRAAGRLVEMTYPGDRIAIIAFSTDSSIYATFTDDKDLLLSHIGRIHSGGSTRYIPAFSQTAEVFSKYGRPDAGRVVIFLSDGEPWDHKAPESIYQSISALLEQGICIYAIGFGQELYEGSRPERILQNIVGLSDESTACGMYHYSPSDELRLTKIFGRIYHDARGEMKELSLDSHIAKQVLYDNETLQIDTRVRSSLTSNYLPGYLEKSGLCGPPATVTAQLLSARGNVIKEDELAFIGDATGYRGELRDLKPGRYTLSLRAEAACSDLEPCNYIGMSTHDITVLSTSRYHASTAFIVFLAAVVLIFAFGFLNEKRMVRFTP